MTADVLRSRNATLEMIARCARGQGADAPPADRYADELASRGDLLPSTDRGIHGHRELRAVDAYIEDA